MRNYLRRRRHAEPVREIVARARKRARRAGVPYALSPISISIPDVCPALGLPIEVGQGRGLTSPSLDRIDPAGGYVEGNVRILSDHANRLKSDLTLHQLEARAALASGERRTEYERLAEYVRRERLLAEVRAKAARGGRVGAEWTKVAEFLDRAFVTADWKRTGT